IAIIIRSKSIIKLYRVHAFKYVSFGFHAAKLQFIFELVRLIRLYLSFNLLPNHANKPLANITTITTKTTFFILKL
ncbi:MAG: hypothetical protein IJ775_01555, partial [Muribaculaceae bacterium]|nr:hypothetical protein [Muribaculaceae bacterium]